MVHVRLHSQMKSMTVSSNKEGCRKLRLDHIVSQLGLLSISDVALAPHFLTPVVTAALPSLLAYELETHMFPVSSNPTRRDHPEIFV